MTHAEYTKMMDTYKSNARRYGLNRAQTARYLADMSAQLIQKYGEPHSS